MGKRMDALMKSTLFLALTGVAASALAASQAEAAVLVVAEARGIAFKPGDTLDSAKPLVLKQGQHVTLISETGSTLKLDGPYDRPPAAGGVGGVGLNQTLNALITQRQARAGEFGITRGTVLAELPDPWVLDATHSGNVCVLANGTPVFWRPDARAPASLSVAPADHSWSARAQWPAGQDRIAVTTNVPMRAGRDLCRDFQRHGIGCHHGAGACQPDQQRHESRLDGQSPLRTAGRGTGEDGQPVKALLPAAARNGKMPCVPWASSWR